jgi:hypothetical protein
MATRNRWTLKDSVMSVTGRVSGTFDLREVSANWDILTETEQFLLYYGAKQWPQDKYAGKDNSGAQEILDKSWERMKAGDFARQAGAAAGVTKKELVNKNAELEARVKELEAKLAKAKSK